MTESAESEQKRTEFIDSLAELLDLLKNAPELPGSGHASVYAWTEVVGDPAPVFAAAKVLGTKVALNEETGVYSTERYIGKRIHYTVLTPKAPSGSGE
jgi:hypothetical protein